MFMQKRDCLRRNRKKGFTLVELLVVIAIMAILAAILIPSFSGYIDRAQNASILAEARAAHVALSVVAQELAISETDDDTAAANIQNKLLNTSSAEVKKLSAVNGTITAVTSEANGTVIAFTYESGTKKVTYSDGKYSVAPTATPVTP